MKCPFCGYLEDKVVDSRESREGEAIRRRRECLRCERRFTFNPANAVSEADKNAVRAKSGTRRAALEAGLGAGSSELQRFRQQATSRSAALQPKLEVAARRLAQAEKDLSVL